VFMARIFASAAAYVCAEPYICAIFPLPSLSLCTLRHMVAKVLTGRLQEKGKL
jgi:hypothetical protein